MPRGERDDEIRRDGPQSVVNSRLRTVAKQEPAALRVIDEREAIQQTLRAVMAALTPPTHKRRRPDRSPEHNQASLVWWLVPTPHLRPELCDTRRRRRFAGPPDAQLAKMRADGGARLNARSYVYIRG